ncbi:Origin recognition complex, subunit 3 [Phytophthora cinnamomi]|uniref:Origin recognition complex, subunit 3 n=1 Tax=Phytophthora cinnamomi TaxID=4785 RepID=UPI00355A7B66|nr:Origin recognition complex, subunit 3 [Phytophthora cinnamomi]
MEAAPFSTGVSIQYPHGRLPAGHSAAHRSGPIEYPFAFPADSSAAAKRQFRSDTEAYSVCQELAYHFACEKTRRAVQELLRKNNDTSYSHVLRFFEKYCVRDEAADVNGSTAVVSQSPSGRRLRDPNAPVLLPQFHAFPTAAVIAGTDATSSDLWVEPLTHKLRRTFPLCVPVQRDVSTARRFVEWLAARMAKLREAKKREEKWIEGLVDNFDLLPLDQPPVGAGSVGQRVTRQQQAKANATATTEILKDEDDKDAQSDASFFSESSSDGSDSEEGVARRGKRKRRLPTVAYGRWTMSKLLTTIQNDVDELVSPNSGDSAREWVSMLGELVHARIAEALTVVKEVQEKEDAVVIQTIAYANVLEERLQFEYHDNLRNVLQEAGIGEDIDPNNDEDVKTSWVHDVGLAFLFYQESASASMSLREWYESFSAELKEESKSASKSKKRKAGVNGEDAAIKARFVRAVCTLRHWGFIKHDAPRDAEQDIIEKLVFI